MEKSVQQSEGSDSQRQQAVAAHVDGSGLLRGLTHGGDMRAHEPEAFKKFKAAANRIIVTQEVLSLLQGVSKTLTEAQQEYQQGKLLPSQSSKALQATGDQSQQLQLSEPESQQPARTSAASSPESSSQPLSQSTAGHTKSGSGSTNKSRTGGKGKAHKKSSKDDWGHFEMLGNLRTARPRSAAVRFSSGGQPGSSWDGANEAYELLEEDLEEMGVNASGIPLWREVLYEKREKRSRRGSFVDWANRNRAASMIQATWRLHRHRLENLARLTLEEAMRSKLMTPGEYHEIHQRLWRESRSFRRTKSATAAGGRSVSRSVSPVPSGLDDADLAGQTVESEEQQPQQGTASSRTSRAGSNASSFTPEPTSKVSFTEDDLAAAAAAAAASAAAAAAAAAAKRQAESSSATSSTRMPRKPVPPVVEYPKKAKATVQPWSGMVGREAVVLGTTKWKAAAKASAAAKLMSAGMHEQSGHSVDSPHGDLRSPGTAPRSAQGSQFNSQHNSQLNSLTGVASPPEQQEAAANTSHRVSFGDAQEHLAPEDGSSSLPEQPTQYHYGATDAANAAAAADAEVSLSGAAAPPAAQGHLVKQQQQLQEQQQAWLAAEQFLDAWQQQSKPQVAVQQQQSDLQHVRQPASAAADMLQNAGRAATPAEDHPQDEPEQQHTSSAAGGLFDFGARVVNSIASFMGSFSGGRGGSSSGGKKSGSSSGGAAKYSSDADPKPAVAAAVAMGSAEEAIGSLPRVTAASSNIVRELTLTAADVAAAPSLNSAAARVLSDEQLAATLEGLDMLLDVQNPDSPATPSSWGMPATHLAAADVSNAIPASAAATHEQQQGSQQNHMPVSPGRPAGDSSSGRPNRGFSPSPPASPSKSAQRPAHGATVPSSAAGTAAEPSPASPTRAGNSPRAARGVLLAHAAASEAAAAPTSAVPRVGEHGRPVEVTVTASAQDGARSPINTTESNTLGDLQLLEASGSFITASSCADIANQGGAGDGIPSPGSSGMLVSVSVSEGVPGAPAAAASSKQSSNEGEFALRSTSPGPQQLSSLGQKFAVARRISQTTDDEYRLSHQFDGSSSSTGSARRTSERGGSGQLGGVGASSSATAAAAGSSSPKDQVTRPLGILVGTASQAGAQRTASSDQLLSALRQPHSPGNSSNTAVISPSGRPITGAFAAPRGGPRRLKQLDIQASAKAPNKLGAASPTSQLFGSGLVVSSSSPTAAGAAGLSSSGPQFGVRSRTTSDSDGTYSRKNSGGLLASPKQLQPLQEQQQMLLPQRRATSLETPIPNSFGNQGIGFAGSRPGRRISTSGKLAPLSGQQVAGRRLTASGDSSPAFVLGASPVKGVTASANGRSLPAAGPETTPSTGWKDSTLYKSGGQLALTNDDKERAANPNASFLTSVAMRRSPEPRKGSTSLDDVSQGFALRRAKTSAL